jgi:hypothetical protein
LYCRNFEKEYAKYTLNITNETFLVEIIAYISYDTAHRGRENIRGIDSKAIS